MTPPGTTGPFIRKYIFPGAYVPSLSEVFAATERNALWVADMEVLRLHYHYTLQHWRRRFAANRARAAELYDERFCRMWEYYLAAVDVGFSNGSNMVFQLLLSAKIDAVGPAGAADALGFELGIGTGGHDRDPRIRLVSAVMATSSADLAWSYPSKWRKPCTASSRTSSLTE